MACGHGPLCRHLHEGARQDVVPPAPRQSPRSYAPLARASGASYDSYSSIVLSLSCVCLSAPHPSRFRCGFVCDTQCPATSRCGGVSVCLLCGSRPLCGSLPLCVGRPLCGRPLCGLVPCRSPPPVFDPRHVGIRSRDGSRSCARSHGFKTKLGRPGFEDFLLVAAGFSVGALTGSGP